MKIDAPGINENKMPEQNILAIKGWASDLAYKLTQELTEMESEIENLRKEVEELKEAQNGV